MDQRSSVHYLVPRHFGPRPYGRPVKVVPARITRAMTAEEAFRAALSDCLAQLTANAAVLRAGRSVEGLHKLRVAFRRLEVALGAFGKEFRQEWLEELRGRAKVLSGRMAAARDLDVFVDALLADALDNEALQVEGGDALRAAAQSARNAAWVAAHGCVTSADFARFLDDVASLVQSRLPLGGKRKLLDTAARILDRQALRVEKRGRAARSGEEGDLHRLRMALKKLRYSAEFFGPLYSAKKVRAYLGCVRRLQDELGYLNDVAQVRGTIGGLLRARQPGPARSGDGEMRLAAGMVLGWYAAKTPRALKKALKRYRAFRDFTPFWV
jgi:CHAD domain-containing protein